MLWNYVEIILGHAYARWIKNMFHSCVSDKCDDVTINTESQPMYR